MASSLTNLPSLLMGRVLTKSNASTAIVRVLQMKLDDKFNMFFNQRKQSIRDENSISCGHVSSCERDDERHALFRD